MFQEQPITVYTIYRIVPAISKQVITEDALACRNQCIRVDEPADSRIVVSGLEIIEPGLYFLEEAMRPFLPFFRDSKSRKPSTQLYEKSCKTATQFDPQIKKLPPNKGWQKLIVTDG